MKATLNYFGLTVIVRTKGIEFEPQAFKVMGALIAQCQAFDMELPEIDYDYELPCPECEKPTRKTDKAIECTNQKCKWKISLRPKPKKEPS